LDFKLADYESHNKYEELAKPLPNSQPVERIKILEKFEVPNLPFMPKVPLNGSVP
jgi:hypothetical protein